MDKIGRYKIVKELGRGAMGVVYHAIDPNIGRPVAIKTIRLGEVSNAEERARLRERLFREARSAGRLSHPGIVTIYDVDQQGETAYIAMEFVNGPTLDQVMSGNTAIPPDRVFAILGQTAVALDYAHQKGIVHRDIKPANIMIDEDGQAKITDFGIAKFTTNEQFTLTGAIVGTPHYMSPEQVQGLAVDGRSDQFSLCVVAFEMITGEKPFLGEHLTTVVYKIVAEEPAPAQRLNPSLGGQIEAVLRRGLAKKPGGRFATCQEFVDTLETACRATRTWKPMPRGSALNAPTMVDQPRPGGVTTLPSRRGREDDTLADSRKRVSFLPVFFAIIVAAGLVALIAWQATPWLSRGGSVGTPLLDSTQPEKKAEPTPEEKRPSPMPPPPEAAKSEPPASAPAEAKPEEPPKASAPEESKPGPQEEEPAPPPRTRTKTAARPAADRSFGVFVPSDPPGATAALDGRADSECKTPCTIQASPGRHTVAVTMPGYMAEHREVTITNAAEEVPLITLRAPGGTLMLSTTPPGATIWINGKQYGHKTPAQINLPPGRYTITVEGDGRRVSEPVDIRNGINLMRIPLGS